MGVAYLARINATVGVAGTDEVLIDRLEVAAITVLVTPDGQLSLTLTGGLLAAIVCGAPTNHCGPTSRQTLLGGLTACARQANGYNILGLAHWFVQHKNRNIVVESYAREAKEHTKISRNLVKYLREKTYRSCVRTSLTAKVTGSEGSASVERSMSPNRTVNCRAANLKVNTLCNNRFLLMVINLRLLSRVTRAMCRGQNVLGADEGTAAPEFRTLWAVQENGSHPGPLTIGCLHAAYNTPG